MVKEMCGDGVIGGGSLGTDSELFQFKVSEHEAAKAVGNSSE